MFDIGWTELLLIGIVALIVIGPKDLPDMFRTLGRFTAKARGMAREFSRAMEAAADESGVKDMANDIRKAADMPKSGLDTVKDAARKFEQWDPLKAQAAAKPAATPRTAAPPTPAPGAAAPAGPAPDPGAVEPPPPAAPAAAPARPHGPATQALAEAQAAKRKAASEAAAARRAARAAPPPEADA
ncbi:MAG TPA: Sec-independent protein translocase protein TatB [Paracoccaceae bacterium]|nr:Sec-independent protein translocase protein TatB [Paracoccaceae bacterium]